jgi:hypothetical protein
LGAQPVLHRLLEALGLAAGGGVVGSRVLLDHVPGTELLLEAVAATAAADAGQANRVDHPVVGQGGGGDAVLTCGLAEGGRHDGGGDPAVRAHVQGVAGAVVEPADDLHIDSGGQSAVGEV